MNNLHAPTVPSGPTTSAATNGNAGPLSFAELQRKKNDLEEELKALGGVLESVPNTPRPSCLPFEDADFWIAWGQHGYAAPDQGRLSPNDYKDLTANIERYLHQHFASLDEEVDNPAPLDSSVPSALPDSEIHTLDEPFAKVNAVATGSPADHAGLKEGDQIRNFGYVNKANHDSLKKVSECVQGNEGRLQRNILIKVSRPAGVTHRQELRLTLTPTRNWGGRGLLGCHILPL
ncbi:hypothetical protein UVI_02040380 [Ustilaginoidea virens]|uniref:Probable 26S proteasome regulatory subunit p27 n=1 Tax=Ustilaginoidea virens TaxID=1159556 RepID=A0A1B5KYK2_USTVR|nr:hypothetical protein UVI_02040380 [Ustilaginoidea virens]